MNSSDMFDEEFFEWEERDDSVPFGKHMLAGSIAGIMEHVAMLPVDAMKTHRQSALGKLDLPRILSHMLEGGRSITSFWRGSSIIAMGCVPAHSLYFSIYEYTRHHMGLNESTELNFGANAIVGVFSTAFHDMIMTPGEGSE